MVKHLLSHVQLSSCHHIIRQPSIMIHTQEYQNKQQGQCTEKRYTTILKKNYLSWTMMSERLVGCGAHASATVHRPCVTGTTKGLSIQPSLLNHAWFPTISVKYLWHINKISIQFGATFGHWALTQLQCWQPFLLDFSWRKKDNEMQHMIVLGYQCTNKRSYRNRYRKLKPVIVIYPAVPDSQTRFPKELSFRHQVRSAHKLECRYSALWEINPFCCWSCS